MYMPDVSMWNMYINGMYNYVVWVIMLCMLTWYMYIWWIVCLCVASVYECMRAYIGCMYMFCKYINCLCSTRFLLTVNILSSSILEVIKIYIYIYTIMTYTSFHDFFLSWWDYIFLFITNYLSLSMSNVEPCSCM